MQIKNRGSCSNPAGRFEKQVIDEIDDGWYQEEDEDLPALQTFAFPDKAKSVITYNDSPDLSFDRSINPYRGCEHGCIYCYARPSHEYLNLSAGLDFETKIFYKENAETLLESELTKKKYQCQPIVLGANTDPYQPLESKFRITRKILETLKRYQHPVAIITKSCMIERDIDILAEMAKNKLVKVAVSVTTLSNKLKLILEPRASGPRARIKTISNLTNAGIPVRVMAAPMIPMINDMELEKILQTAKAAGALHASYVLVRLPYEVKTLFKEWLSTHFPERAEHVMSLIKQMRNGKEYDSKFGERMRGQGEFAELLEARFRKACKRFGINQTASPMLDTTLFDKNITMPKQFDLFGIC